MHNINGLKLAVPNFPSLKGGFDSRIPLIFPFPFYIFSEEIPLLASLEVFFAGS